MFIKISSNFNKKLIFLKRINKIILVIPRKIKKILLILKYVSHVEIATFKHFHNLIFIP